MNTPRLLPPDQQSFVLASASPRRRDICASIGLIPDQIIAPDIDETARPREMPRAYALRMAVEKAAVIRRHNTDSFILAADTVVACGRRILPKAESEAEQRACLALLEGRAHRVWGGICLITPDGHQMTRLAESRVQMRRLGADERAAYLASKEGLGKAGGYAIQGLAAGFIHHLSGSWSNIVGLDAYLVHNLLRAAHFHYDG